jgi:hypothetical protein
MKKKSHDYKKYGKNKKTKLSRLKIHHKNSVVGGDCRAVIRVRDFVLRCGGRISRIQGYDACIAVFRACRGSGLYRYFDLCFDFSYHVINILNYILYEYSFIGRRQTGSKKESDYPNEWI